MIQTGTYIEAAAGSGQDRMQVFDTGSRVCVALADGAGGMGGGTLAADTAVQVAMDFVCNTPEVLGAPAWMKPFLEFDQQIGRTPHAGETTLLVADMSGRVVSGASVGDSGAWLVRGAEVFDLTQGQHRKPLMGSGDAVPVPFTAELRGGVLLAASDGLFRFTTREKIVEMLKAVSFAELPRALVNLVRLRSGKLQDDVAVFVATERASGS